MSKIGKTELEIDAVQLTECRQIVRNIVNFGVTEKQKIQLVYLLSLELESRDALEMLVETVEKIKKLDENIKFSLKSENSEYNENIIQEKNTKLLDV